MKGPVSYDDASVDFELSSMGELQWLSGDIGYFTACFSDDQRAAGMVPNLFSIVGSCRQPKINVCCALRYDGILGLTVQP